MDFLVVRHDVLAPAGVVGERIAERGGVCVEVMPSAGEVLPETSTGFGAMVILGGLMSAGDDAGYPHYSALLGLIRNFDAADKPVMGICLGAQLIARAYGRRVYRMEKMERGFRPVRFTPDAASDPVLKGLGREQRLMQWHNDTFELPAEARLLMTGDECPNQAFRVGNRVYGFQFHPEATPGIIRSWVNGGAGACSGEDGASPRQAGRMGEDEEIEKQIALYYEDSARFARLVTDRWLELAGI